MEELKEMKELRANYIVSKLRDFLNGKIMRSELEEWAMAADDKFGSENEFNDYISDIMYADHGDVNFELRVEEVEEMIQKLNELGNK